jgi:hypothetical protein
VVPNELATVLLIKILSIKSTLYAREQRIKNPNPRTLDFHAIKCVKTVFLTIDETEQMLLPPVITDK